MKRTMIPAIVLLTVLGGCRTSSTVMRAEATLDPRSGSDVQGVVRMAELQDGTVRVEVDATGLEPNSPHGFHVHENGDCSAADASSAGGHFNPTGAPHGGPTDATKHAGDFGNLQSDSRGEIHEEFVVDFIRLTEGSRSALNRAVVLHADRDDLTSQPSGDSGDRIGCGVLRMRP